MNELNNTLELFVQPIFENILKPMLNILKEKLKIHRLCEKNLKAYLCKTFNKTSILNTLIFPNQQIDITQIYLPLTLVYETEKQEKLKIDSYPNELFKKFKKILISDSAGMGKSTMARFICLQSIKENKNIPVFIELRRINSKNTIIIEFLKQLNPIDKVFDEDFIYKLLNLGKFVIILDGFDEISNTEKEVVTQDIRNFVLNCSENYFLLTSRPEGALSTFGEFQLVNIKGLKKEEAFELIDKFDSISKKKLREKLINEIQSVNKHVYDFLINPFLVSLLYKTYSFKKSIPSKKSTFYYEVYTALYQEHDLTKDSYKRDKHSKLDMQEFRLVLRELADCTLKRGEVEYSKINAIQYIASCKNNLKFLEFNENDFLTDLLTTVPIFIKEGNDVKWAHKSLQDYFAAEYIISHPKNFSIINHLISKDVRKYQNIIDLIIELEPNLIRHFVLPDILRNLITTMTVVSNLKI